MPTIVAVTPAGRRRYLALLAHYILADETTTRWELWDESRNPDDRRYIEAIVHAHEKIKLVRTPDCDGSSRAMNRFSYGWRSPQFAAELHQVFIAAVRSGEPDAFHVPDQDVALARFSINCIGFFNEDVRARGTTFCPPEVDDEEWISAVLPALTGRPGRVLGDLTVSHFSFPAQETALLQMRVLCRASRSSSAPGSTCSLGSSGRRSTMRWSSMVPEHDSVAPCFG